MYVPAHFAADDPASIDGAIDAYPFATLVSQREGEPFATHLPLLRERRGNATVLLGHVARANPHWRALAGGEKALAIFHGPHGYISPRWYASANLVPTWNYVAVHCTGRVRLLEERAATRALIVRLVERFEAGRTDPWMLALDPKLEDALLGAIVAFELVVERVEAKFKLSQNRSPADRTAMLESMAGEPGFGELYALSRRALDALPGTGGSR